MTTIGVLRPGGMGAGLSGGFHRGAGEVYGART